MTIRQDRIVGLAYIAIGALAGWIALGYGLGSLREIGAGVFPLCLGIVLVGMGIGLVFRPGQNARHDERFKALLIPALYVCGSIVLFAILLPLAGLLIASFTLVFLSSFAHHEARLKIAILNGAIMTFFAWALFVFGLGLPLRILPVMAGG